MCQFETPCIYTRWTGEQWSRCSGAIERCARGSFFATKLSRLDACEDGKVVRWFRTQASCHNSQGVVDGKVNEAGVNTAAPCRSAIGYSVVESTTTRVAVRNVVAPTPQPESASRLNSATRDVNFLRSDFEV